MIISMTGFGRHVVSQNGIHVQVEIKSLNSRYRETNVKLPQELSFLEVELNNAVKNRVARGKLTVSISIEEKSPETANISLNEGLLLKYHTLLEQANQRIGGTQTVEVKDLLNLPDLFNTDGLDEEVVETKAEMVHLAIDKALDGLIEMRKNEGKELQKALSGYLNDIENSLEQIIIHSEGRVDEARTRLSDRIKDLVSNDQFDQDRLELEIALLADKLDINEEIVRLRSHIKFFFEDMDNDKASGRKLNFLAQEMNREINTIGAKANNAQIQHLVVGMKEVLEQIREQVQNVE